MTRARSTAALAVVLGLLLVAGCASSAITSPAPSIVAVSVAPATSPVPVAKDSPGPEVVGSQPGTVAVDVGTGGAGFADVTCEQTGDGGLTVSSGALSDGELFVLVFGSDGTVATLSGALRGVEWRVTQNAQGTLNADWSGSFSGKDEITGADVSGTFACK